MIYVLHDTDRDGYGGKYVAWRYMNQHDYEATYLPLVDRHTPPDVEPGSEVYMIDYSFPPEVLIEWVNRLKLTLTVLDHHESFATEILEWAKENDPLDYAHLKAKNEEYDQFLWSPSAYIDVDYNKNICGTLIAWDFFFSGKRPPRILEHVNDYDLWKWELPYTDEILTAFDLDGWEPDNFNKVALATSQVMYLDDLKRTGDKLVKFRDKGVADLAKTAAPAKIGPYIVPLVECPSGVFRSKVGHKLLQDHPEAPFSAMYYIDGEQKVVYYSLRSKEKGVDVGALASLFGGGGHTFAAGFDRPLEGINIFFPQADK